MKIRFPNEITLSCIQVLAGEYEGEQCTLDMACDITFHAGQEFDNVAIDEKSLFDMRLWLRDDLVALKVHKEWFEIIE